MKVAGAIILGLGLLMLLYSFSLRVGLTAKTTGEIVAWKSVTETGTRKRGRGTTEYTYKTWYPVVRYEVAGQGYNLQLYNPGLPDGDERPLGEKVPLIYNPKRHERASVARKTIDYGFPLAIIGFGSVLLAFGVRAERKESSDLLSE